MAAQGLAAAFELALGVVVVEDDVDEKALLFVVLEDDDEAEADGDPHGLGMAAPVDPSSVLFELLLLDAVVVLPPPICASMSGS